MRISVTLVAVLAWLAVAQAAELQTPTGPAGIRAEQVLVLKGSGFGPGPADPAAAADDATGPRVLLGDAENLGACTVTVPQTVSAWSDSQITMTVVLGALPPDGPVWAHILAAGDLDGIIYGSVETPDRGPPGQPGQPGQPRRFGVERR